jgi:prefoldin alpha subunit
MVNEVQNPEARDLQTLQMYLNEYGQQAEILTRQLEMLDQRRVESAAAVESLKSLSSEAETPVVLVPLGGGATVRAKVLDAEKVLVNFGADVVVQRTNAEATAFLEERITEIEALEKRVAGSLDQIRAQANDVARRIDQIYQQQAQQPLQGR